MARDMDAVGRGPQSQDLRVVPNRDIHVVGARQKQQGVARGAEFAIPLDAVDLVDLVLDGRRRHGRVEEEDVGPKVGLGSRRNRAGGIGDHRQKQAEFHHRSRTSEFARTMAAQYLPHFAALPADWDPWILFSVPPRRRSNRPRTATGMFPVKYTLGRQRAAPFGDAGATVSSGKRARPGLPSHGGRVPARRESAGVNLPGAKSAAADGRRGRPTGFAADKKATLAPHRSYNERLSLRCRWLPN